MVTTDNYEEYLMMQADGELDAQELRALQAFLDRHPQLASEAAAWQEMKLAPDETIRYERQDSLLKDEPKAVAFRPWYLAVPAAAALLLALFLFPGNEQTSTTGTLAGNTAPTSLTIENDPVPAQTQEPQSAERAMPVPNPPVPSRRRPYPRPQHLALVAPATANNTGAESIARLQPRQSNAMVVESRELETPQLIALAEPLPQPSAAPDQGNDSRLRIQLAAANIDALNAVKSGIDQRVEQIGRAAKAVRESAVVIKLGGNAFQINL